MSEEFIELMEQYSKMFNDGFPSIPLYGGNDAEERCTKIIKHCLEVKKDVYELGYYSDPPLGVYY